MNNKLSNVGFWAVILVVVSWVMAAILAIVVVTYAYNTAKWDRDENEGVVQAATAFDPRTSAQIEITAVGGSKKVAVKEHFLIPGIDVVGFAFEFR